MAPGAGKVLAVVVPESEDEAFYIGTAIIKRSRDGQREAPSYRCDCRSHDFRWCASSRCMSLIRRLGPGTFHLSIIHSHPEHVAARR